MHAQLGRTEPLTSDAASRRAFPAIQHSIRAAWRYGVRYGLGLAVALALVSVGHSPILARSDDEPYSRFVAQTDALTPSEQQKKFHLRPGFEIELVAAEPQIRKPINLSFDSKGRLLVTGSVEYPHAATNDRTPRDAVWVLADTDRDAVFDRFRMLASGLNIPVGVTPVPRGVLAFSIPTVDRFLDLDGGGRAGRREVVYCGFGFDDTHGMPNGFVWWIDGWVYACHGEGNTSRVAGSDGQSITLHGGSTFRMRPDGSRIEHFTHGQVNPFGLCCDPLGNAFSADSNSKPATMLLRGAWYPGFVGARHDGLGFAPAIMQHVHGSTGIAGIAYYDADQFPAEYRDTLFIGNPVTGRINHDRLEVHGSTYRAIEQPDFLTCDDPWFRPVDVRLGPDGALYIADFYNRIIGHSEVPLSHTERDRERGRIWRIVYKGNVSETRPLRCPPDLSVASLDELLDALNDGNLTLRTMATHELVERIGPNAIDPIKKLIVSDSHPWQRVHGLWVLHRLSSLDEQTVRRLAQDSDRSVRVHLVKTLAERNDWVGPQSFLHGTVLDAMKDRDAFVRRAAADALGRHPSQANIDPLLHLWASTPADDTLLIHTARMALRDNLQALGGLSTIAVRYSGQPGDPRRLADVSLGIPTAESAEYLFGLLKAGTIETERSGEFLHHVVRYASGDSLPNVFAFVLTLRDREQPLQRTALRAVYRATQERGHALPDEIKQWAVGVSSSLLTAADERSVYSGIELAWDLELSELAGELAKLAGPASPQPELRSFAIDALGAVGGDASIAAIASILGDSAEPLEIRSKAAESLGTLNVAQVRSLLGRHLTTAPAGLDSAIAQQLARSRDGGELLLAAIVEGKATARLIQDAVVDHRLRDAKLPDVDTRLAKLREGLAAEDVRLRQLIGERRDGLASAKPSRDRGRKVFEKHCATCHELAGLGNKVGPQLDGIGGRGTDRLLEDILDPNRNVDQKYRSSVIALADGRILNGLVVRQEGDVIVLADSEGKSHRLQFSQIAERRVSSLSAMPANAAEIIAEPDFYDLIAFLLGSTPGK